MSLQKIATVEPEDWQSEFFTKERYGGYNDMPPNWREITMEEFATSDYFTYSPVAMEFRQFIFPDLDGKEVYHSVFLYFMQGGGGYALVNEYWKKKVRVFRFALCEHDWRELSTDEARDKGQTHFGMCYHVLQCKKCGQFWAYDSSD